VTTAFISAVDMQVGTVMALPFGKTATVTYVKVGRQFVNFRTEWGASRVEIGAKVLIEVRR
jgi:hypothetical protein